MIPKILKNFNLFIDGRGYAGKVEEVNLPKLNVKTEEFRAGGMDSPALIDMGIEKLESTFTLLEYDKDILKQFGVISGNVAQVTLRGAMQDESSVSQVVVKMRGMYTEIDMGKISAGEKGTLQCTLVCRYYALEIDGEKLIEIDIDNMTRIIGGQDKLIDMRKALGI